MEYFKSDALVFAKYEPSFKLIDKRIFEYAIYLFQNQKSSFTNKDYEELCGIVNATSLKTAVERLKEIRFTIEGIDGIKNALIFEEINYDQGKIDFKFSEEIKVYISIEEFLARQNIFI